MLFKELKQNYSELSFPCESENMCNILYNVLNVDKELNHKVVKRTFESKGTIFSVKYESQDVKKLRAAINNMMDNLMLVLKTMHEFSV